MRKREGVCVRRECVRERERFSLNLANRALFKGISYL